MFVHPDGHITMPVRTTESDTEWNRRISTETQPKFSPGDVVRKHGKLVAMTVQSVFPPESGRWRYWVHYVWDGQIYAKVMDESDLEAK